MSKSIEDVCIVVQARLGSTRVPGKMLRTFANTTLVDILLDKLNKISFPTNQIFFSVYENELIDAGKRNGITIFHRSEASANEETHIQTILEWHNKLPFKYVIMISACNPLMKIETINQFITHFLESDSENLFGVFKKKTYYWDSNGVSITNWKGLSGMDTKQVDPVYEAAHCLYASPMDIIADGYWLSKDTPPVYDLFEVEELESFDIDYEWQFTVAETLYNHQKEIK